MPLTFSPLVSLRITQSSFSSPRIAHEVLLVGGQGIASGFRDAISLAWRLAVGCNLQQPNASKIKALFSAWYGERKQQLERSLASTIENGDFVTARNPVKIFFRDWHLWLLQLVPSLRHQLQLGNRREGLTRYRYQPGMSFVPHLSGGRCFPQVYCRSLCNPLDEAQFTDDVIWRTGLHKSLFRLVLLPRRFEEVDTLLDMVENMRRLHKEELQLQDVTIFIQDVCAFPVEHTSERLRSLALYRVATADEFACSSLCHGRPVPKGYDPYRMSADVGGKRLVFLRPDRFVFAACNVQQEAMKAAGEIVALLAGDFHEL